MQFDAILDEVKHFLHTVGEINTVTDLTTSMRELASQLYDSPKKGVNGNVLANSVTSAVHKAKAWYTSVERVIQKLRKDYPLYCDILGPFIAGVSQVKENDNFCLWLTLGSFHSWESTPYPGSLCCALWWGDHHNHQPYHTLPYTTQPTLPYPAYPTLLYFTLTYPTWPTLPYPTLFYPSLPYPTLLYHTYSTLSYHTYPTLSYPTLPSPYPVWPTLPNLSPPRSGFGNCVLQIKFWGSQLDWVSVPFSDITSRASSGCTWLIYWVSLFCYDQSRSCMVCPWCHQTYQHCFNITYFGLSLQWAQICR